MSDIHPAARRYRRRNRDRITYAMLALASAGVASTFLAVDVQAAADDARTTYVVDRANCEAGKTAEDRATCLREAGAAQVERKRNGLVTDPKERQNALDRCNALPQKDRADCVARVEGPSRPNQETSSSGSVSGGGVIRETKTTTPGAVTVIPSTLPASAPPN